MASGNSLFLGIAKIANMPFYATRKNPLVIHDEPLAWVYEAVVVEVALLS
jgi:hypothetical protein